MKRWPLRIILCLILGAITTVAVAWGVAWTHSTDWPYAVKRVEGDKRDNKREWLFLLSQQDGIIFVWSWRSRGSIHPEERPYQLGEDPDLVCPPWAKRAIDESVTTSALYGDHDGRQLRGYGWPKVALWSGWQLATGTGPPAVALFAGFESKSPSPNPYELSEHVVLPTRIATEGFLIDTLFYAAIWGGVFFGFTSAKRLIRVKRGRCPRCGYDLRGDLAAGCSECGWNREEPPP